MGIDITTLAGADLASMKTVAGQLSGWVNISSVVISSPVEFVDFAQLAEYREFAYRMCGIRFDDGAAPVDEEMALLFSPDAGATFYNDIDGGASYRNNLFEFAGSCFAMEPDTPAGLLSSDALAAGWPLRATVWIVPGSDDANDYATAEIVTQMQGETTANLLTTFVAVRLQAATGRQNLVRFLPFGPAEGFPGNRIIGGTIQQLGVPA